MNFEKIAEKIQQLEIELKGLKKSKTNFKKAEKITTKIYENFKKADNIIITNNSLIQNEVEKEYSGNETKQDRSHRLFVKYIQPILDFLRLDLVGDCAIESTIEKYRNYEDNTYLMERTNYRIIKMKDIFWSNTHLIRDELDNILKN